MLTDILSDFSRALTGGVGMSDSDGEGAGEASGARGPPSPHGSETTWDFTSEAGSPRAVFSARHSCSSPGLLRSALSGDDDDDVSVGWDVVSLSSAFSSRASSPGFVLSAVPSVGDVAALAAAEALVSKLPKPAHHCPHRKS